MLAQSLKFPIFERKFSIFSLQAYDRVGKGEGEMPITR